MDFLLFLVIFGIALSSAWHYTTLDQKDDLDDHMRD